MRLAFVLIVLLGGADPAFADSLALAGERFQPKGPIVWKATNSIPETIIVYKVGTQHLSDTVISNVLKLTGFKFSNRLNPRDKVTWEFKDNKERPRRFLKIAPTAGWVWYLNEDAKVLTASQLKGIPSSQELTGLLYSYLPTFEISTNDLKLKPEMRTEAKGQHLDKKGGKWSWEVVYSRGIGLPRQIDGIPLKGAGVAGGITMEFANEGKIFQFNFLWRKYEPYEKRKALNKDELLELLKKGKAVRSFFEEDISGASKYEVVNAQLVYDARAPFEDNQELMFPFINLELYGDLGTNKVHFWLDCPVLPKGPPETP